nr:DUF192 domain-containing protein [Candidatus Levybacteria bacterium]
MLKNDKIVTLKTPLQLKGVKKIIGLMGEEKPQVVIFKTHFGIHTFFLKFPIDIVILSKNNEVMITKKSIKPKKIVFWNPKYNTVIEMPEGTIKKLGINIGSILKF